MKHSLTVCFLSARFDRYLDWFLDSLLVSSRPGDMSGVSILMVDKAACVREEWVPHLSNHGFHSVKRCAPKPTVWQGPHRLTKDEWWAKSAYLNTALCVCETEWIAFLDDRCVVMPGYFEAISDAMEGGYAVAGRYEKGFNLVVENGSLKEYAEPTDENGNPNGKDPRASGNRNPRRVPGNQFFGCNNALPLEWALTVNGWDESCDSLGLEDCVFGEMLARNNFPIMYDERMFMIEDRTPGQCDSGVKRTDKGKSPHDKSHAILRRTHGKLSATHDFNLRELRDKIQRGEPFPIPTSPTHDWYDHQLLSQFP